jgi:hypothetical protein
MALDRQRILRGFSIILVTIAFTSQIQNEYISFVIFQKMGTQWRSWLRYCTTNRKVVGSIPGGVTGICH